MSRANDTGSPSLPSPQGGPSRELQAREVEGLIRFLASVQAHEDIRCAPVARPQRGAVITMVGPRRTAPYRVGDLVSGTSYVDPQDRGREMPEPNTGRVVQVGSGWAGADDIAAGQPPHRR